MIRSEKAAAALAVAAVLLWAIPAEIAYRLGIGPR